MPVPCFVFAALTAKDDCSISDINTDAWQDVCVGVGLRVATFSGQLEASQARDCDPFGWGEESEAAQHERYMTHLQRIIPMPSCAHGGFDWHCVCQQKMGICLQSGRALVLLCFLFCMYSSVCRNKCCVYSCVCRNKCLSHDVSARSL